MSDSLSSPSELLHVLLLAEAALICVGSGLLLRRVRTLAPRLLGRAASPLPPSNFSPSELALSAAFAFAGAVVFHLIFGRVARHWLPASESGTLGPADVIAGAGFQLGLLAGLAHAWFWHLRPMRRPAHATPTPPHPRFPLSRIVRGGLFTFLVALVVVGPVSVVWQTALEWLGVDAPPQDLLTLFNRAGDRVSLIILIAMAVLVAPITEESAFRVGLFRWFRGRFSRSVALLAPAFVFAAVHGNLAVLLPLVALAVVLALGYEHYGHPAVPMLAHALFNLNTIVLLLAGYPV